MSDVRAIFDQVAGRAADAPDAREQLALLLTKAAGQDLLECAKSFDAAGQPPLPRFVVFDEARKPVASPPQIAWRRELDWVPGLLTRLTPNQLDMLTAVNRWLRDGGADRPVVPTAERSVELFDDEKAIDRHRGGATLWQPGRLTHQLLRCEPTGTPLVSEPSGDGDRLLLVENQATFVSARRVLRKRSGVRFGAVAWGQGHQAPSRLPYVLQLPSVPSVVEYFGDLDVEGLEIAAALTARAAEARLPAVVPCKPLYDLLAMAGSSAVDAAPVAASRADRLVRWLPAGHRDWAYSLLTSGRRAAQERVGYESLMSSTEWAAAM